MDLADTWLKTGKIISMRMVWSQERMHVCISVCTESSGLESYTRGRNIEFMSFIVESSTLGSISIALGKRDRLGLFVWNVASLDVEEGLSYTSDLWPDLFSKELVLP